MSIIHMVASYKVHNTDTSMDSFMNVGVIIRKVSQTWLFVNQRNVYSIGVMYLKRSFRIHTHATFGARSPYST